MAKEIWARVGCTVTLPKDLLEYKSEEDLQDDFEQAVKSGSFRVDGDTYAITEDLELNIDIRNMGLGCDLSREEPSQELVDKVLAEIVKDVQSGDHTAIEELLKHHSVYALRGYLPEEGI